MAREESEIFPVLYVLRDLPFISSLLCSASKIVHWRVLYPEGSLRPVMALTELHMCNAPRTLLLPARTHFPAFRAAYMPIKGSTGAKRS